ncbi:Signal peptide peptidase-like 1 [Camellia lanceoleosa]|uniref:Signal peptide peptidase-like 1 n=1 Tax=Camellia lanceoleosa TaxID=1840588 RepID=A0ACC0H7M7_9ERIC|nr:Signal peptide peptidase-like 1 [Camellia lanceoleosa]
MEPLWKLAYLLEPAPLTLIFTAIAVTSGSAFRALNYGKEMERNRDFSEASITLDRSQALMIPIMSSFSLLLMFYLFSSVSQLLTAFTAIASVSSLYFCIWPYIAHVKSQFATQQASNPVHTVANSLNLPGLQLITKKLELPVKIVFPRNLFGGVVPGSSAVDYMMLGLGDMAIPAMLLALVLCFDHRKSRDSVNPLEDLTSSKGHKYIWFAISGYAIGLVTALAAGILTHSPQPALLYLVPSTLGPIIILSWIRNELMELWEGTTTPNMNDKIHLTEV